MAAKKKILIIAETGISAQLFRDRFQHFIDVSQSCACVELASLNTFTDNLNNNKYTHVLLAPNAHILKEHVIDYLGRVDSSDTCVELISETDYLSMNVGKIMIDQL